MNSNSGYHYDSLDNDEFLGSDFSDNSQEARPFVDINYEFSLKGIAAIIAFKFLVGVVLIPFAAVGWNIMDGWPADTDLIYLMKVMIVPCIFCVMICPFPTPFRFVKEYYLMFSCYGISGSAESWLLDKLDLDKAVEPISYLRNGPETSLLPQFTLTEVADTKYISWENFHSFTCHKDCIMLWRESDPPIKKRAAQWAVQTSFSLNDETAPLRVCCNNINELSKLRAFLAERLPEVHTHYAGLKVIF